VQTRAPLPAIPPAAADAHAPFAAQVGLLIGKPVVGSRSLLLAVVPSPEQVRRATVQAPATQHTASARAL
jgi:hypothetical protein